MKFNAPLCAAALLAAASVIVAQPAPTPRPAISVEERTQGFSGRTLLAKPLRGADRTVVAAAEAGEGTRLRREFFNFENIRVLEPAAGETVEQAIERLRATGRYEYVEPDHVMTADATPNDPQYLAGNQWGLRNVGQSSGKAGADIRAEDAWEIQSSASNVVVAIVDSGIRATHEDLAVNLWPIRARAPA